MQRERRPRGPFRFDQRGVSPVVGTILILVIMIFSIGGIMTWGVPAIQGLQERAEYQSVLTQFLQMQSDVRGLRDPQNTRITQISVNDGQLTFDRGSRWVVTGVKDPDPNYEAMYLTGWEADAPDSLTIAGGTIDGTHKITVDRVVGGSVSNIWTCVIGTCNQIVSLDDDDADTTGDVDFTAIGTVIRVQVHTSDAKWEAWIVNAGHLEYHLTELNRNNRLHFEMGAVFTQQDTYFYVEQAPTVKDPDYTLDPQDISLFVRLLQLSGVDPQGVSGRGEYPILYHLVDNYGSARGRPSFDPAYSARIQIHGELEVPFCNYFQSRFAAPYGWIYESGGLASTCPTDPDAWATTNVNLRYEPDAEPLVFDLSHSVVTTNIRTS